MSNVSKSGLNRFVATVDTGGNGSQEKLNAINGKDDVRLNLVQWYRTRHSLLFLTLDSRYRNASQR